MLVNIRNLELKSDNFKIWPLAGLLLVFLGSFYYYFVDLNYPSIAGWAILTKFLATFGILWDFLQPNWQGESSGNDVVWLLRLFDYFLIFNSVISVGWDGVYELLSLIASIGVIMYTTSCLLLLIVSLILLLAMAGSILVTVEPLFNE